MAKYASHWLPEAVDSIRILLLAEPLAVSKPSKVNVVPAPNFSFLPPATFDSRLKKLVAPVKELVFVPSKITVPSE